MQLVIQHTDHTIELGLFDGVRQVAEQTIEKFKASAQLIPTIQQLLTTHNIPCSTLSFIAANAGPGPFTTLRTILATVNGLGFAAQVPLIGIDGLDAMLDEAKTKGTNASVCVALFNAFTGDLFVGIDTQGERVKGWKPHRLLLEELKARYPDQNITFVGSGVLLYKELIQEMFGSRAIMLDPLPIHASLNTMNAIACELFAQKQVSTQLLPLYLKTTAFTHGTVHFV